MPVTTFDIQLDNPHRSYFAGQHVTGVCVLVLTERSKVIHGVKLKLQGKAKTHWKEANGRSTSYFSDEEVYIDEKVYLAGYETEASEMNLDVGTYNYKFDFILPPSLPSSFCHKYGEVKYYLEATITRSLKANFVSKTALSVIGILDLNKELDALKEGEMENEKVLCCFFCASGPLGFHFKIPKKGFVPGERIGFQVHLFNHSNRVVNSTAVVLIQKLSFTANFGKTKTKTVQITQVEGPMLEIGETKDWIVSSDVSTLKVPSLPPSRLEGCQVIEISYFLKFKMETKNGSSVSDRLGIVIGTIPLADDFAQLCPDEIICQQTQDSQYNGKSWLLQYPEMILPTYEEAINGVKAEDAESSCSDPPDYGSLDWNSFIPKYPSYRFYQK